MTADEVWEFIQLKSIDELVLEKATDKDMFDDKSKDLFNKVKQAMIDFYEYIEDYKDEQNEKI